jgi:hypothetical protein
MDEDNKLNHWKMGLNTDEAKWNKTESRLGARKK